MSKASEQVHTAKNGVWQHIKAPFQEFFSFDKDIIKYMAMHWVGGRLLIYSTLLPIFMNRLGINIVKAGAIFSLAALFDVVLTYILGKFLDRMSPNVGMALDWFTESFPPIIYGFAMTGFHFLLGALTSRMTNILNPVYKIYENEIYTEEKRSLIYTYHLLTPEVFSIIMNAVVGYLLAYKFTSIMAFRVIFWICGIGYLFVCLIPLKGLRWVPPTQITRKKTKVTFPKELYLAASAQIMVFIGLSFTSTLLTSYYILDKLHGTVFSILMLEVVTSVIVIITGLFTKNLSSVIPEEKIAQYGIFFFIGFAVLMVTAKSYTIVLLAFLCKAIGNTVWFPHHFALLMKFVPREKRGEFFGSVDSLGKLLGMMLPLVSAFLAKKVGFFMPFTLSCLAFVGVCIMYQLLLRKRAQTEVAA